MIEKLVQEAGETVDFTEVLLVGNTSPENAKIGTPFVASAKVSAKVLEHGKADKKIVFKYTNKARYKKKKGHRQPYTEVEILKIVS